MMGTWLPETCWATSRKEIKYAKVTFSWFFLSTLNYDARSTTHQMFTTVHYTGHRMVIYYDIMNCVSVKYDVSTTVLSLPPYHVGAVNISQKLNPQRIRSPDHWHTQQSPDNFKNSVLLSALFLLQVNPLTPNDHYSGRTAPLTSKRCLLYICSTNKITEYFKHGIYSTFFSLQNAVCFIILTYLVPVLFTFYIQGVLKLKK